MFVVESMRWMVLVCMRWCSFATAAALWSEQGTLNSPAHMQVPQSLLVVVVVAAALLLVAASPLPIHETTFTGEEGATQASPVKAPWRQIFE